MNQLILPAIRTISSAHAVSGLASSVKTTLVQNNGVANRQDPSHNGLTKLRFWGGVMESKLLTTKIDEIDFDMTAIAKSIESSDTQRPDWVKTGKDFVRWMKLRRDENNNGDSR